MLDLHLISAEVLKLRRRRGMLALALLITLGLVLIVFAVTGIQHASDPIHHGVAGGAENWRGALSVLLLMTLTAGVMIGGTAGTQDVESGVFRDLAATGRSRLALFGARVTGAWAIVLPIVAVMMAALAIGSIALAGSTPAPTAGAIVAGTGMMLVAGALSSAMSVGLSALVGSRGPVIGMLLAFFLALEPLLAAIGLLGDAREAIPSLALERIGQLPVEGGIALPLGVAAAVVLAWSAATLALGAWKTRTREI